MVDTVVLSKEELTKLQLDNRKQKVLIIGYGKAGKRHAKIAKELGLEVIAYDNDGRLNDWTDGKHTWIVKQFDYALSLNPDYAVICTPPETHIDYIIDCNLAGLKILCEKPLCDLGKVERMSKDEFITSLMLAYNWRYHPLINQLKSSHLPNYKYRFEFSKHRSPIPTWGLLLDNLSHDLDLARYITGQEFEVVEAQHYKTQYLESWKVNLSDQFYIVDTVYAYSSPRVDLISRYVDDVLESTYPLEPDDTMFYSTWNRFLSGDYMPDLAEGIKTQQLIEQVDKFARYNEIPSQYNQGNK